MSERHDKTKENIPRVITLTREQIVGVHKGKLPDHHMIERATYYSAEAVEEARFEAQREIIEHVEKIAPSVTAVRMCIEKWKREHD